MDLLTQSSSLSKDYKKNMVINILEEYLELFTLEEILEQSDLTHIEALTILYRRGYIVLPPYLQELADAQHEETDE